MTQVLTRKNTVVAQQIVDHLRQQWSFLGLPQEQNVYYGDEDKYPSTPAIAVEPGPRRSPVANTGLFQTHEFTIFILTFLSRISGNLPQTRKLSDELAEKIEVAMNANLTLDGAVIHGHVVNVEPGVATRGELMFANRLTWEGISRTQVGSSE